MRQVDGVTSASAAPLLLSPPRLLAAEHTGDPHGTRSGFRLLGPLSVTDGHELAVLPASKPATLLAALLLRPNVVVPMDRLKAVVWDEAVPSTAKAALHTCVRRLRRILAAHDVSGCAITAVPGGYRISADAQTLDLIRFRELLASARRAPDPEAELRLLRAALAEWHGPLLANISSSLLHRDETPHLAEERLWAIERAIDLELQLGRCREVVAELWELSRAHPQRERFWEQLIEALYRTGRQAEALAEYRGVKGHLQEQLGIDPGPALQQLELAILRGDDVAPRRPAIRAVPAAGPPQPVPVPTRPTRLPPAGAAPSFTGRKATSARLLKELTAQRTASGAGPLTVVLSGPPGIGKTALALHVADLARHLFPGGRRAIRLTRSDGTPRSEAETRAELEAAPALGDTSVLMVLDDVIDEDHARALLPSDPSSATILTSRSSLSGLVASSSRGIVIRPGLFTPEESRSFLTAVLGAERVAREPEALDRLAEVCGHFPLALRITATRLLTRPLLCVADYVNWLEEDPLARLSVGAGDRLSVNRVFSAALDRLSPDLAEAFVRLGASEGVQSAEDAPVLEQLADAGFVEECRAGRFQMHSLLRQFARARLARAAAPLESFRNGQP